MQLPVGVPPIGFRESVPTRPSVSNVTSKTVVPNGPLENAHSRSADAVASSIFSIASENGKGGKPALAVAVGCEVPVGMGSGFACAVGCSFGFVSAVAAFVVSGVSIVTVDVDTAPELELDGAVRKRKNATAPTAIIAKPPTITRTRRTVPAPEDFLGSNRGGGGAYAGIE